jgi:hypothetical protein
MRGGIRGADRAISSVNPSDTAGGAPEVLHWSRFSIALLLHCHIALTQSRTVKPKRAFSARQGNLIFGYEAHRSVFFEAGAQAAKCQSSRGMTLVLPWSMTLPQSRMVEPEMVDRVKEGNRTLRDIGYINYRNKKYIISLYIGKHMHLRHFALRGVQGARA